MTNRKYPRLKEVDDVLGGAAAWENVDSTKGKFEAKWQSLNRNDCMLIQSLTGDLSSITIQLIHLHRQDTYCTMLRSGSRELIDKILTLLSNSLIICPGSVVIAILCEVHVNFLLCLSNIYIDQCERKCYKCCLGNSWKTISLSDMKNYKSFKQD